MSLCLFIICTVKAEGPIQLLSSTTRNNFPEELFFDIAVANDASDMVSIDLIFRMRGETSDTVVPLDFTPERHVEASYRWYTENITVPPSVPIEYQWVIVDEADSAVARRIRNDSVSLHVAVEDPLSCIARLIVEAGADLTALLECLPPSIVPADVVPER